MKNFFKKYNEIMIFIFIYWIICFIMFINTFSFLYVMLAWNVFLAVLPLFFIKKSETYYEKGNKVLSLVWTILWLLFFPNSIYLVTDFIHISNDKFIWVSEFGKYSSNNKILYSTEIIIWAKLLVIAVGFIFAILVGLESLYIFEKIIRKEGSKSIRNTVIIIIGFLSGIGIYIGRFLRFNSWDVFLSPIKLLGKVINSIDLFAVEFISIFTLFFIIIYTLFKIFRKMVNIQ